MALTRRTLLGLAALVPFVPLPARAAMNVHMTIKSFKFSPAEVEIKVGDTVEWINEDSAPHTATAADKSWTTPTLNNGDKASVTFDKAGTFAFACKFHPSMKGVVKVVG